MSSSCAEKYVLNKTSFKKDKYHTIFIKIYELIVHTYE
jgi:hypothetical protein